MKKALRISIRVLASLAILLVLVVFGFYLFLKTTVPDYSGEKEFEGITAGVDVYFDDYGIPHILAEDKLDAYRILGYQHAAERMYQMEMMRRVGSGRLSEILGNEFVETDKLFRSLLPSEQFEAQAKKFERDSLKAWYMQTQAYLDGINRRISENHSVPELMILGVEPDSFTVNDIQAIAGYMAYSFGLAQRTDPLVNWINQEWGPEYLENMALHHYDFEPYIPPTQMLDERVYAVMNASRSAIDRVPLAQWYGSNSWVVSGQLTRSGKPILCNDTHIGYSVPQTWYESHIRVGDFELYGNFLPGVPFALVGHNDFMAWGLTMLEQDDMDFYAEKLDESGENYLHDSIWIALQSREVSIALPGGRDTTVIIRHTHHGPIVNDVYDDLPDSPPMSLWWDYARFENKLLHSFYKLNNCSSIDQAALAASMIHGPGLNLTYADTNGNIAWWACAKIQQRNPGVNGKLILDGTSKYDQPTGYYSFAQNPHSINPPWEFVYSANDQPGPIDTVFIQGYFKPHHRADRIKQLLPRSGWTAERMKQVVTDVKSPVDSAIYALWADMTTQELPEWNGNHEVNQIAPAVYYRTLYHTLRLAMVDELGEQKFETFLTTHWMKRAYPLLLTDPSSPWWDDKNTTDVESINDIVSSAIRVTYQELKNQLGPDPESWKWEKQHKLQLTHSFSDKLGMFGQLFNSDEKGVRGGHETINQSGFLLTNDPTYQVKIGSQMRIICDLDNPRGSLSCAPSGQSGHFLSPYYMDQFEMYCDGKFRSQLQYNLSSNCANHLHFSPSYK